MEFDKKTIAYILNVLRQGTIAWEGRRNCLIKARERFKNGYFKNGNPRWIWKYRCAECSGYFREEAVEVDHIKEIGGFKGDWNSLILRMYDEENLQCLCVDCHRFKTAAFNAAMKWDRR